MEENQEIDFIYKPVSLEVGKGKFWNIDAYELVKSTKVSDIGIEDFDEEAGEEDDEPDHTYMEEYYPWDSLGTIKLSPAYWFVYRLIKYTLDEDFSNASLALGSVLGSDLTDPICQMALKESFGYELLLNILECIDIRCQSAALKILSRSIGHYSLKRDIIQLGGIKSLTYLLTSPCIEIRSLVAEVLSLLGQVKLSHDEIDKCGCIPLLIELIALPPKTPNNQDLWEKKLNAAKSGAKALAVLCKNDHFKRELHKWGGPQLLTKLLRLNNEEIAAEVIGVFEGCATLSLYRKFIKSEGILDYLIKYINIRNETLTLQACRALSRCAQDVEVRENFGSINGLSTLVDIIREEKHFSNSNLMSAVINTIWKMCYSYDNIVKLTEISGVQPLIRVLGYSKDFVLVDVIGALGCCAQVAENCVLMRTSGAVNIILKLLASEVKLSLLINIDKALAELVRDKESIQIIEKSDGIRLLWTQLKIDKPSLQIAAALSLSRCLNFIDDFGYLVRSFVGGIDIVIKLLEHPNEGVLAAMCELVNSIVQDFENLAILTDYDIVRLLSNISETKSPLLRKKLANAVAACCKLRANTIAFGKDMIIPNLVGYMKADDLEVDKAVVLALYNLSSYPLNCVRMYKYGIVDRLVNLASQNLGTYQEYASLCLKNIRYAIMKVSGEF